MFEASDKIGGQFGIAQLIPGKEEFAETIRYYTRMLDVAGVTVKLETRVAPADLIGSFDEVVVATGVTPRVPKIPPGIENSKVLTYAEVVREGKHVGKSVAVIGAGGIGVDVSEFLTHPPTSPPTLHLKEWKQEWGVTEPKWPPGRSHHSGTRALRAGGLPPPTQARTHRRRPREDHRLGPPGGPQEQGRPRALGRQLRAHRRRRPAHHLR